MNAIHNRADMARALTLDLDPQVRAILTDRIAGLTDDLIDYTSFVVIGPNDDEADIVREVGFSPLIEPIDGIRYGAPGFGPFWDWLADHGGVFELAISFGSTFAYILLIRDADGTLPELLDLCRRFA